jgi:hypothetical protein
MEKDIEGLEKLEEYKCLIGSRDRSSGFLVNVIK